MNQSTEIISPSAFARLDERVTGMVKIMEEIKTMLVAQAAVRDEHAKVLAVHAWIWKLTGTVLLASIGVIAWGWNELELLKKHDNEMERRLLILEYRVTGSAPLNNLIVPKESQ
jgi:uncharacterized lipoprotein YddW (UPF0748 family)